MQWQLESAMNGRYRRRFLAGLALLAAGCGGLTDGKTVKVVHAAGAG